MLIGNNYILLEIEDGVAILTLNRPSRMNAVTASMRREFADALSVIARDDNVKAVILTGAGSKAFCAGTDVEKSLAGRLEGQKVAFNRLEQIQRLG